MHSGAFIPTFIPSAVFPLAPSPNQTSFLIEGKIDLRLHKPNLHGDIALPEFHEKDTAKEFTGSSGLSPKTETNEEAEFSMGEQAKGNATHALFCGLKSSSWYLLYFFLILTA